MTVNPVSTIGQTLGPRARYYSWMDRFERILAIDVAIGGIGLIAALAGLSSFPAYLPSPR